jgi:hypothetical protein
MPEPTRHTAHRSADRKPIGKKAYRQRTAVTQGGVTDTAPPVPIAGNPFYSDILLAVCEAMVRAVDGKEPEQDGYHRNVHPVPDALPATADPEDCREWLPHVAYCVEQLLFLLQRRALEDWV